VQVNSRALVSCAKLESFADDVVLKLGSQSLSSNLYTVLYYTEDAKMLRQADNIGIIRRTHPSCALRTLLTI
jgi:hypothetical protein